MKRLTGVIALQRNGTKIPKSQSEHNHMHVADKTFQPNRSYCIKYNNGLNFRCAPFFVSPARHVEAQDMSGT
jgi:hypothetical protein